MSFTREKNIFIVDGEQQLFQSVSKALGDLGVEVTYFVSPGRCLEHLRAQRCDLLIIQFEIPGINGVELLKQVKHLTPWLPVLILTRHPDIPTAVNAIKAGAEDVIQEPFERNDFLLKIKSILDDGVLNDGHLGRPLTHAEIRVLKLVIAGKTNKEIANILNRSIRTVEVHREHIMRKLGVDNLVDLVKRVVAMNLVETEPGKKKDTKPVEMPRTSNE